MIMLSKYNDDHYIIGICYHKLKSNDIPMPRNRRLNAILTDKEFITSWIDNNMFAGFFITECLKYNWNNKISFFELSLYLIN
jgi:hypothetical protein